MTNDKDRSKGNVTDHGAEDKVGIGTEQEKWTVSRRKFLGLAGAAGVVGATGGALLGGLATPGTAHAAKSPIPEDYVAPGQLDEYYGIWSGGQSAEIRLFGVPSMREFVRVPVFQDDFTIGWGITNESKRVFPKGPRPAGGDLHHPHMSMTDARYDGRYIFANDKANSRVARIRVDVMRTDKVIHIPNAQDVHGLRVQRVPRTGYVFCCSECRAPHPNDGRNLNDPKKYSAVYTAIDGDTMKIAWQVLVDGNLDNTDADYSGKYTAATCYNSEGGVNLAEFIRNERDWTVVFNIPRIEKAVKDGHFFTTSEDPNVPVVDGRHGSDLTMYVPTPKNPHGCNATPDGKYVIAGGKLSPTCTVISWEKVDQYFEGKLKKPMDVVVAQPELGLGPLHTAYDARGNAYTTLFIDSQVVKWDIEKAIRHYNGEKVNYIRQKLDVAYQPGHNHSSLGETRDADGKWLVSLNKFSKDRFLPVGPLHPDNDQLIDISGPKMRLVADAPVYSEPHDCLIIPAKMLVPKIKRVWDRDDPFFAETVAMARRDGVNPVSDNKVIRDGHKVRVYMTAQAPVFGMDQFEVNKGDEVTVVVTNINNIQDLTHGWCLSDYGINMEISPQETSSVTFIADKAGVYWYYCSFFCHALHLEMRGRMLVKA
jgi:nitrous-oxide reductase